MEKQRLLEPLAIADKSEKPRSILGKLALVAFRIGFLPAKIWNNFPIEGRRWRHEGHSEIIENAAVDLLTAFIEIESVINPRKQAFGATGRLAWLHGGTDMPSLLCRALDPDDIATPLVPSQAAIDAVSVVILYDDLVKHYSWESIICPPFNWNSCSWAIPSPPPISHETLSDLYAAANKLGHSLRSKDDKITLSEMQAVYDRQRSPPADDSSDSSEFKVPKRNELRILSEADLFPQGRDGILRKTAEAAIQIKYVGPKQTLGLAKQ